MEGPDFFHPVIKIAQRGEGTVLAQDNEMRFGYVDLYVTTNLIYALYSGKSRNERPEAAQYRDKVMVFNLNGDFVDFIELDRKVLRIAVSEEKGVLFASDFENKRHDIIQYDIPQYQND